MTTPTTNPLTGLPVGVDLAQVLRLAAQLEAQGQLAEVAYRQAVAVLTPAPGPTQLPPATPLHIEAAGAELILRRGNRAWMTIHAHELDRVADAIRRLRRRRRSTGKHEEIRTYERRHNP